MCQRLSLNTLIKVIEILLQNLVEKDFYLKAVAKKKEGL